jgi:hypothetical protein
VKTDPDLRHFFTGEAIKTELLVVWLEKHGIPAVEEPVDPGADDDGDLSRPMRVLVASSEFERAQRLFFEEREDEL